MAENKNNTTTKQNDSAKPKATPKKKPTAEKPKAESKKKEIPKIDVRIFAVPERKEFVKANQEALDIPDDRIVWDEKHEGAFQSAQKAWSIQTESPFIMVMNDDVELCDDFMKYCEMIVDLHPDSIISLFPSQFRTRKKVRNRARKSPYVLTKEAIGIALIMKKEFVKACLESWTDDISDDANITRWAKNEGVPIITTLPSLVQHIGDDSIIDPKRAVGRTDFFVKNPSGVDWSNSYISAWSNVVM